MACDEACCEESRCANASAPSRKTSSITRQTQERRAICELLSWRNIRNRAILWVGETRVNSRLYLFNHCKLVGSRSSIGKVFGLASPISKSLPLFAYISVDSQLKDSGLAPAL